MQHTLELLDRATQIKSIPEWTRELKLSRNAINNAKNRGHLSPIVAGALAVEMGEDATKWIAIAALELERDSACKERMLREINKGLKL